MTLVTPNLDVKVEKCIQDTNGRFLILDLLIDELHLILVNIYAPNDANQQVTFFKELENQLEDFAQENIIIAGDFNCALSENDKKGGNSVWKKSIVIKEVQHVANLYQFNRHLARSQSERQPLHLEKQIAKSPMPTRLLFNFKRTQQ